MVCGPISFVADGDAVAGGQDPLRRDDRAAAEAALILHRGIETHLPGIFALGRLGAGDDHLVIVRGDGTAARGAESDEEDCDKRITP